MVQEVLVPDIGDYKDVPVIDILVKPGDRVEVETPLVTLESDKATLDVRSPAAGVVKEIKVKVGDKVSQGTPVVSLETDAPAAKPVAPVKPSVPSKPAPPEVPVAESRPPRTPPVESVAPEKPYLEPAKSPGAIEAVDPLAVFQTPAREHGGAAAPGAPPPRDEGASPQTTAG